MRLIIPIIVIVIGGCMLLDAAQEAEINLPPMPISAEQAATLKRLGDGASDHAELEVAASASTQPTTEPFDDQLNDQPVLASIDEADRKSYAGRVD